MRCLWPIAWHWINRVLRAQRAEIAGLAVELGLANIPGGVQVDENTLLTTN